MVPSWICFCCATVGTPCKHSLICTVTHQLVAIDYPVSRVPTVLESVYSQLVPLSSRSQSSCENGLWPAAAAQDLELSPILTWPYFQTCSLVQILKESLSIIIKLKSLKKREISESKLTEGDVYLRICKNNQLCMLNRMTILIVVQYLGKEVFFPMMSQLFFFFVFFSPFSWAVPVACGSSQARGRIRAVATGLRHSHSNSGSEMCLHPTPQLMAMPDP